MHGLDFDSPRVERGEQPNPAACPTDNVEPATARIDIGSSSLRLTFAPIHLQSPPENSPPSQRDTAAEP